MVPSAESTPHERRRSNTCVPALVFAPLLQLALLPSWLSRFSASSRHKSKAAADRHKLNKSKAATMSPPPTCAAARVLRQDRTSLPRISACTLVRNGCAQLPSWIEFHRHVGVSHFTLYDVDTQDCTREVLRPYVQQGLVELVAWPEARTGRFDTSALDAANASLCLLKPLQGRWSPAARRVQYDPKMVLRDGKGACPAWHRDEMLRLCATQVRLTDQGKFDILHTPFNWVFCQYAQIADCVERYRDTPGWLGVFDVDEYVFPTSPAAGSLQDALRALNLRDADHTITIEGMLYGNGDVYAPLQPTEFVPQTLRWHAPSSRAFNARSIGQVLDANGAPTPLRAYALKSFYRMPHALRYWAGSFPTHEVHHNLPLCPESDSAGCGNGRALVVARDGGALGYNHYMYRSVEELALANQLIGQSAKANHPQIHEFFNRMEGTRMEHLLPRFLHYWRQCVVPSVLTSLKAYAQQRAAGGVSGGARPGFLTAEELEAIVQNGSALVRTKGREGR